MNRVDIDTILESKGTLRYTLSGVAVLECKLRYAGMVQEANIERKLNFVFEAIALDQAAKSLDKEDLGLPMKVKGFLAVSSPRSSKLILHITEYVKGV